MKHLEQQIPEGALDIGAVLEVDEVTIITMDSEGAGAAILDIEAEVAMVTVAEVLVVTDAIKGGWIMNITTMAKTDGQIVGETQIIGEKQIIDGKPQRTNNNRPVDLLLKWNPS